MKSLILFSGGTESTAILYDLLKNTDDQVWAHRIHMGINPKRRLISVAEKIATRKILDWMEENVRPVENFSETFFEFPEELIFPGQYLHAFIAGTLNTNYQFDRIFYGQNLEDLTEKDYFWRHITRRIWLALKAHGKPHYPGKYRIDGWEPIHTEWVEPYSEMGKVDVMPLIPRELWDFLVTCDYPIIEGENWEACRRCVPCIRYQRTLRFIAEKKEPVLALDVALLERHAGKHRYNLVAPIFSEE